MSCSLFLSFLLPFVYALIALITAGRAVSFRCFFYIFALFFYSIAAFVQFFEPLGVYTVSAKTFFEINCILLLCYGVYDIIYFSGKKIKFSTCNCNSFPVAHLSKWGVFVLLLLVCCAGLFYLYYNNFSLRNVLFRGGDVDVLRMDVGQISVLFIGIFRIIFSVIAFSFICFSKSSFFKCIGIGAVLFFCAPTATARYFAAVTYIPLLVILFPAILYSRFLFKILMVVGLLVVFPLLDLFRNTTMGDFKPWKIFSQLHFDSYISFAYVYEREFITNGYQLLGSIFFWLPRSYWPGKPVGSGHTVAEMDNLFDGFANISMNFLGEGYINFGMPGVFLFISILAVVSKKMDRAFWVTHQGNYRSVFAMFYFYSLGMLIFILRGDLLSSTAYLSGILFILFLYKLLLKRLWIKDFQYTSSSNYEQ